MKMAAAVLSRGLELLAAEERRLLTEIQGSLLSTKEVADRRAEKVAESRASWSLAQLKREESWQEGQMRLLKAEYSGKQARGTDKEDSTSSKERQG